MNKLAISDKLYTSEKRKHKLMAAQIIVIGFLTVILVGAFLLTLPISSVDRSFTDIETALFTAVSATCITGLAVVDTFLHWSVFGQCVILVMIQIGGLGFMTLAVLLSMLIKRRITPRERLIIAQSLGLSTDSGMLRLIRRILFGTFVIESLGAIVLSTQFIPIFGFWNGLGKGIFHSVSAFCNAGFDLFGGYSGEFSSLGGFRTNVVVNVTIMLLIIIGGIGFLVWNDFYDFFRHRKHFSVYSRFVIIATAILIFGGAAAILGFEWNNPATIGSLSVGDKILASFFHSVSTRTAGFATIDNSMFSEPTKVISLMLMFIGGASSSTAGGVKVNTIGIIIYSVFMISRGQSQIVIFRRKISNDNLLRAMAIVMISFLMVILVSFVLISADNVDFMDALYESISAIATVGLSLGITPTLGTISHAALMILMFFGRVGILTITYSIMLRMSSSNVPVSYPDAQMLVG